MWRNLSTILLATVAVLSSISVLLLISLTNTTAQGQLGLTPIPTSQETLPTYVVRIPPGAAMRDSPIHYYPDNIAIPSGITVVWFNDDPGQPHTVTSGEFGSKASGAFFNSGIIPYTAGFQHTFDGTRKVIYHCEIHPWRIGVVSVSNAFVQGQNFILASGTGQILNLTQHPRTLLDIKPITVRSEKTTPITYTIAIIEKNRNNNTVPSPATTFSRSFFSLGNNDLQLELIPRPDRNTTVTYGPDFTDPITGAYHVEGNFMKPGNDYTIRTEITAIGSQILSQRISDDFNFRLVS
jgi:plastocyanin